MFHAFLLATVLHVTIDVTIDQKPTTKYRKLLEVEQKGSGYVVEGAPVDATAVSTLSDTLMLPAFRAPTLDALGLEKDSATRVAGQRMESCPGVSLSPAARDEYIKAFTDQATMTATIDRYFAKPLALGIPPGLSIHIDSTTSDGESIAETSSRYAGLLPWQLTRNNRTDSTFNPKIGAAAAPIVLAAAQALHDQLLEVVGYSLTLEPWESELAYAACSPETQQLALAGYLPKTLAYLKVQDFALTGQLGGADSSLSFAGTIAPVDSQGISMSANADASGGDEAMMSVVRHRVSTVRRIAAIPWISRLLARDRKAKVEIEDPLLAHSPLNFALADELDKAGFTPEAQRLRFELKYPGILWVPINPVGVNIFVFNNSDVLIVDFRKDDSSLPFTSEVNARILSRARTSKYNPSLLIIGAIVHPDGSVDP